MPTQQKIPPSRGRHARQPAVSPERRDAVLILWGIAFAVLLSIPLGKIPVISLVSVLLKGLFGLGYYFVPISFLLGGYLLLAHPGLSGILQALICGIIPIPAGSLHHAIFCAAEASETTAQSLWETGLVCESGGVISGGFAQALISAAGNTGTAIVCVISLAAFLGIAFLPNLFQQQTNRQRSGRYDTQETFTSSVPHRSEPESHTSNDIPPKRVQPSGKSKMAAYDIPMDGDVTAEQPETFADHVEASSFYIPKSDSTYSPDAAILQILGTSFQTVSDISPEPAPAEQPKPAKQPEAYTKPVRRSVPWEPVTWTPPVRSEPAWAIPTSSAGKFPEKPLEENTNDTADNICNKEQSALAETKQESAHPDSIAAIPEDFNAERTERILEEVNQPSVSFILIGYQKPQRPQRISQRTQRNIPKLPAKPVSLALPPARKPLLVAGRNAICSIKKLPAPKTVLLLPPHCSEPLHIAEELLLAVSKGISVFKAIKIYQDSFDRADDRPSRQQGYHLHNPESEDKEIGSIPDLSSSSPVLLLPPAPSHLFLPAAPGRLLLPAQKEVFEMEGELSDKKSFVLIGYTPPQKRVYHLRNSKSESYEFRQIKEFPAPIPVLFLPPASTPLLLNAYAEPVSTDSGTENTNGYDLLEQNQEAQDASSMQPPFSLFNCQPSAASPEDTVDLASNAEHLSDVLKSFGVKVTCGEVVRGPAITRYEFTLERGVKLSKITNLADDIALALGASGVRIAPVPGKVSIVGIEVPNKHISPVYIRDVLNSPEFKEHKSPVAFAIGKDIANRSVIGNIAVLPHVLIAGTTGSGKSVCTNSLIISILCKASPDDAKFIMVDPKMVELAPYNGIPHLLVPVVTDPKKAAGALQWAVYEMMKRYKRFSDLGVKKLSEYNERAESDPEIEHMPAIVIVIDELADLMLVAAKEVEESICRVAQMGRAAGMHLVIATQRPSSDVITGLMKANIPSRIAFAVASSLESRIILDSSGAEKLVGRGDMLYAPLGTSKPLRVQGCYITPEEIERVVSYVKSTGEVQYSDEIMEKMEEAIQEKEFKNETVNAAGSPDSEDERLLKSAVEIFLDCGQASVSMLQRRLKLGYSRAARLVDLMEERGYVGPFEGSKARKILISREEWDEMRMGDDGEDYGKDEYL